MNFAYKLYVTLRDVSRHPLTRHKPFRAMTNFITVQCAVRLLPGEVCVSFPAGTRLLIPPSMKGAAHFITPGLCEFDEMGFSLHLLREGDTMIDVGANIGAFTVLASAVRRARTVAFEPSPFTYTYLKRNIALNDIGAQTRAVQCAVGRSHGELRLTNSLGTENCVSTDQNDATAVSVPVRRLDDELAVENPTFIKIDVEGFEADVIAGASQTLKKPSLLALIVERNGMGKRYGFDEAEVHATIRRAGFSPFFYSASTRELRPIDENAEGNIIYIKDRETVAARLREASHIEYRGVTF